MVYSTEPKEIVIVVLPNVQLLHAAGPSDVFTYTSALLAKSLVVNEAYRVTYASADRNRGIVTNSGISMQCSTTVYDIQRPIDTLLLTGESSVSVMESLPGEFFEWIRQMYPNVRRMVAICSATFILAKAGLLDHRTVTTHYELCPRLKRTYPLVNVDTHPFFLRDGNIYTSGGVTSGMNLSLSLVEEDFGREIALKVARKLVLELRRPGNQTQFGASLPAFELKSGLVKTLRQWLLENIAEEIRVEQMAEQLSMSPRNFARVFLNETGLTPAKFLEKLRIEIARKYLEDTQLSTDQIAEKCGLGSMVSMRRVFLRHLKVSPSQYRNGFSTSLGEQLEEAD